MARPKKHPRLPNGYGSIKKLSGNRSNPYAVYPPTTEFTLEGVPKTPKAICYVDDWFLGFSVLTAFKAGTYYPGLENELKRMDSDAVNMNDFTSQILADHNRIHRADKINASDSLTFADVYEQFYDWKYNGKKEYSNSTMNATSSAYKYCSSLYEKSYSKIDFEDMQAIIDGCTKKHATLENICGLFKQMGRYAVAKKYVDKNPADGVKINVPDDDEHGIPFSDDELKKLWSLKNNEIVEPLLIMCYSGLRIGELTVVEVNMDEQYFHGGVKTTSSKNRYVPFHPSIYPIIKNRMDKYGRLINGSLVTYRKSLTSLFTDIGFSNSPVHTPHDCRHTFSMLCERYGVRENDRKRMLGHSFSDVTNSVYGHRSIEDLRKEIKKIKICR